MSELFRSGGFDPVSTETNIGVEAMRRTLSSFADPVRDAVIGVVFFAGHGVEIDGRNYLAPIDAALFGQPRRGSGALWAENRIPAEVGWG